jgi:hypothetical protein
MKAMQYSIWIEAEQWSEGEWNVYDDNTDAIVTFKDGSRWVASFNTYKNIYSPRVLFLLLLQLVQALGEIGL